MSSRGQPTRDGPPAGGLGAVLKTPHRQNVSCYEPSPKKDSDRFSDTCEHGNETSVPYNAGNFLTSWEPVSFSRTTLFHEVSNIIEDDCYLWWLLSDEVVIHSRLWVVWVTKPPTVMTSNVPQGPSASIFRV